MLAYIRPIFEKEFAQVRFADDFVLGGKGHTAAGAKYHETRKGNDTAAWYVLGRMFDLLSAGQGVRMLNAIETLQVTDEASPYFGCMRWYAEEDRIYDSNGAFFVMMPLVVGLTVSPDRIPAEEREIILRMLRRGGVWFAKETEHGPLHYPNKILSDGAMALAIAYLTENEDLYRRGTDFFRRWIAYTTEEGWGWGENMSINYNLIIFAAIRLAMRSLKAEDADIAAGLRRLTDETLDTFRFFDGHEFTPAIRNYNFGGSEARPSVIFNLAGVPGSGLDDLAKKKILNTAWDAATFLMLFDGELYVDHADYLAHGYAHTLPVPRTRITHVMRENHGYSWVGKNGSLGSYNNFPVLPDSYQHKTWGLGWQCMPLNAVIYGACVLYTRWVVASDAGVRIHPKHCYLSPALFDGDAPFPSVRTRCRQKDNALLGFRLMEDIDRAAGCITDEWYIPDGRAVISTVGDFTVIDYGSAALIAAPLAGGKAVYSTDADGAQKLSVVLASSDDGHIQRRELAGGWAVVFHDSALDMRTAQEHACALRLSERIEREPHFTDHAALYDGDALLVAWDFTITEESTK